MPKPFYNRLGEYFSKVGEVLRGEAEVASIFPNNTDVGMSRELIYAEFLKQHAPSKCNVYLGGFLFGEGGDESKQLDIIISNDTSPRYNFHNKDNNGKSFGPVEGCLGVASIKSTLDKTQLFDSLESIASIPPTQPLGKRINPLLKVNNYDDWPLKIVYASNGLQEETILRHINDFYNSRSDILITRRPDIIHVAGKYVIFKIKKGMSVRNSDGTIVTPHEIGEYSAFTKNSDVQAIVWTLDELQKKSTIATHINFDYSSIINNIKF